MEFEAPSDGSESINLIGFVRNGVQNLSWKTLFGLELIWRTAIL